MSKPFEKVIASYGYPGEVQMSREAAINYVLALIRLKIEVSGHPLTSRLFRIVGYRVEDHMPDGSKGVVIAQCEPLQGWRPGPEETK